MKKIIIFLLIGIPLVFFTVWINQSEYTQLANCWTSLWIGLALSNLLEEYFL